MIGAVLLELYGECRSISGANPVTQGLTESLQQCGNSPVGLLTDWGAGAVFGISTVIGKANTAPALLEKQLRDQGVTDDIAHLLVHQTQTRMGSTELVYTAVPIKTWRRYQQLAVNHPQLLLIHDWVSALMHWAKTRSLSSGVLMVLHPQGLDVVVMEASKVRALDRLQVFKGEGNAWGRLDQRVMSMIQDLDVIDAGPNNTRPHSALLIVCRGSESFVPQILQGLSPVTVREVWAEAPDLVQPHLLNSSVQVLPMEWDTLTTTLPLRQAVNSPVDKAAAWSDRWAPAIGTAAFGLSCIMAITSAFMHYQTQVGLASISGNVQKMQTVWQTLNTDVQQAEQLTAQQKDMREWVRQRVGSSKVPDMSLVLLHIKNALPPSMVIDEVGLVIDKDTHLVTVIGHADLIEDSLRSESTFAQALQLDGFTLKKRDLLMQDGQPKFKLSMTWSAT